MNKKGFTLIELLAVIIILAVIALIATPVVLNVVDKAKKSAAESSVAGYADAIKLARVEYMFDHNGQEPSTFTDLTTAQGAITVSGETPSGCDVTFVSGVVKLDSCYVTSYSSTKLCKFVNGSASCE